MYKDKTARIIPNAISLQTESERYFLTSFVARDKTFATLHKVWQMAINNTVSFQSRRTKINELKVSVEIQRGFD